MSKKAVMILVVSILLLVIGGVFWWWQVRDVKTSERPIVETSEEEKIIGKIQELEKELEEAKKRLEEIEKIDPGKLAEKMEKAMTLRPLHATEDQTIEGVTIIEKDEKKIVKNENQGYTIEVPVNLILTRSFDSSQVQFHDPEIMCATPQCYSEIAVFLVKNPEKLLLEDFVQKKKEIFERPDTEVGVEELIINGEKAYEKKTTLSGSNPTYAYYFSKDLDIYVIFISRFRYQDNVKTFKFE